MQTARSAPEPPAPTGWLSSSDAAAILGLSNQHTIRLGQEGLFAAVRKDGRWWLDAEGVTREGERRRRWVSYGDAAEMANCSPATIRAAVRRSQIAKRGIGNHSLPSLDRESVESFAHHLATARQAATQRRKASPPSVGPPTDGDVWLDASTTAVVLGLSRSRVGQLSQQDRIPSTFHNGRRWYRRRHVEQLAAARTLAAARNPP